MQYLTWLPTLVFIITLTITYISYTNKDRSIRNADIIICVTIICFFIGSSLVIPLVLDWWKIFGYIHYIMLLSSSLVMLITACGSAWHISVFIIISESTLFSLIYSFFSILSVILLIIEIPVVVLPGLQVLKKLEYRSIDKMLDVNFIDTSFENIKKSFNQIQDSISRETSTIDRVIENFKDNFRLQEKNLEKLQDQLTKTREEVIRYKELEKLTQNQKRALINLMNRTKYIDYIVGLVLGIIGAIFVQQLPHMVSKIKSQYNKSS